MGRRLALVYVATLLAFFVAPLDNYFGGIGALPVRPTVLFVLGFAPIWVVAARRWLRAGAPIGDPTDLTASNTHLVLALGFTVGVALLWNLHPEIRSYELGPQLGRLYGLVNLLGALALGWAGLRPRDVELVLLPALLVILGTMYLDVVTGGTFVRGYRAAGVAENSNVAGFVVTLLVAATLDYARFRWRDLLRLLVCGTAVVWSGSRAAILVYALVISVWLVRWIGAARHQRGRWGIAIVVLSIAVALGTLAARAIERGEAFSWTDPRRFVTLLATEGPETLLFSADRLRCAQYSLDAIPGAWVLGRGTGFTTTLTMGPHNMFLEQWVSNGLLGVAALCWLLIAGFGAALSRRSMVAGMTVLVIALQCFFSHNLLDERPPLLVLGLVMATSTTSRARRAGVPVRAGVRNFAGCVVAAQRT